MDNKLIWYILERPLLGLLLILVVIPLSLYFVLNIEIGITFLVIISISGLFLFYSIVTGVLRRFNDTSSSNSIRIKNNLDYNKILNKKPITNNQEILIQKEEKNIPYFKTVYITKYNSNRIIKSYDISYSFKETLLNDIEFEWFNDYEIKYLLALRLLYNDINAFLKKYNRIKTIDEYKYFEEGKKPAYHKSLNCSRLNSAFNNFELTNEMRQKGLTESVREWYKTQKYLYNIESENDRDIIVSNCLLKFGLKEVPRFVNYENSSYNENINYNIETIKGKLDSVIKNANCYYKSKNEIKIVLDNYGKAIYYDNSKFIGLKETPTEYHDILKEFARNHKAKVAYWLGEYYRIKFNKDIAFEGNLLEKLGFQECSNC